MGIVRAVAMFLRAFENAEEATPGDDQQMARFRGGWEACLASLGRFQEAELRLLESYEQLKSTRDEYDEIGSQVAEDQRWQAAMIKVARRDADRRTREALQRIINLYEAWDAADPGKGHAEKAAEWRAKLPTTQPADELTDQAANREAP